MKRKFRYRRTSEVKITNEARVLRQLRLAAGFSIRETGRKLGRSETYIRHIENGRMDVPIKEEVMKILDLYGASWRGFSAKSKAEVQIDSYMELKNILPHIPEDKLPLVLTLIKGVISS